MGLVGKEQKVTLYQVGDVIGSSCSFFSSLSCDVDGFTADGSFNNFLDALDRSFCTFEGGNDPTVDGIYPDPAPGGYKGP